MTKEREYLGIVDKILEERHKDFSILEIESIVVELRENIEKLKRKIKRLQDKRPRRYRIFKDPEVESLLKDIKKVMYLKRDINMKKDDLIKLALELLKLAIFNDTVYLETLN